MHTEYLFCGPYANLVMVRAGQTPGYSIRNVNSDADSNIRTHSQQFRTIARPNLFDQIASEDIPLEKISPEVDITGIEIAEHTTLFLQGALSATIER